MSRFTALYVWAPYFILFYFFFCVFELIVCDMVLFVFRIFPVFADFALQIQILCGGDEKE